MRKRIVSVLLAALMCLAMLPDTAVFATSNAGGEAAAVNDEAGDSHENDESTVTDSGKSLLVDEDATVVTGSTYKTIQAAIDYISEQDDKDGWTINIKSGTYTYFTVNQYISNLTIAGENGATVDCSTGSIQLMGDTITLEGITFTASGTAWSVPVIKDALSNAGLYYDSMVTIENCVFTGKNAGCALWICRLNATVQNCTFDGFSYAIEIINETSTAAKIDTETTTGTIAINGNTVTNCDFFIHYGVRSGITLVVTDNYVVGSEEKVCASLFAWEGESITVTGNTFVYAAFGLQNAINGVSAKDFLDTNTFIYSYTADDYYNYSTKADYSVTYYAPKQAGYQPVWSVSETGVSGTMAEYFAAALEGHENDNPLTFTTTDGEGDLVCMGLAYHALNLTYVKGKYSEPSLTKVIVSESTDYGTTVTSEVKEDSASAGDTVKFKLTSVIPTTLQDYIDYEYEVSENASDITEGTVVGSVKTAAQVEAEASDNSISAGINAILEDTADDFEGSDAVLASILAEALEDTNTDDTEEDSEDLATYLLTFHDVLDSVLTLDQSSITVKLVTEEEGTDSSTGETVTYNKSTELTLAYYTLYVASSESITDGCTFEIVIDLLTLYSDGKITEEDFGNATIVVTYSATLDKNAEPGAYSNTAWVTYPEDGKSEEDKVTVKTYGISVFKYDQSAYTANDTDSSDETESGDEDSEETVTIETATLIRKAVDKGLQGAEFTVYSDEACTKEVKTFTSSADGYAFSGGLAAGTYYLKETTAPKNYVSSNSIITIEIPDDVNGDTYLVYVDMANAAIPDTGGMGTTIFRIVGGCLLLAAVIVFIVSRRKRDDDEE